MPSSKPRAGCTGSKPAFNPSTSSSTLPLAFTHLQQNDFASAIRVYFSLPADDAYIYRAIANVTLAQVQHVVELGGANGLHDWYYAASSSSSPPPDATGGGDKGQGHGEGEENPGKVTKAPQPRPKPLPPPAPSDIEAYIQIFHPTTSTPSALKAFHSNAKKDSLRFRVATYLLSKRFIHPSPLCSPLDVPKVKSKSKPPPHNPYLDFWSWSCASLQWTGPCPESEVRQQSHHVLPILMHHFGCAVPSHEGLSILTLLAAGRTILDVGSGNGYWTFMLRQYGCVVQPIDNVQSEWRCVWVDDTLLSDGAKYLSSPAGQKGGQDAVLLMVYPIVGGTLTGTKEGGFTRDLMGAYKGDTVAVVGTQNRNGYTGFRNMTFDEYMEREQPTWTKVVQIPLPSFAGKDEALFVYQRGERAERLKVAGEPDKNS